MIVFDKFTPSTRNHTITHLNPNQWSSWTTITSPSLLKFAHHAEAIVKAMKVDQGVAGQDDVSLTQVTET